MARAAGTSHVYGFWLNANKRRMPLHFPSVTHVCKFLKDEFGVGPMAWWGFSLGAHATAEMLHEDFDEIFTDFKKTDWDPNTQRDRSGEGGREAHTLLEYCAKGQVAIIKEDGEHLVIGQAQDIGRLLYGVKGKKLESFIQNEGGPEAESSYLAEGKELAAAKWWLDNQDKHNFILSEKTVISLKYGYAGTLDFAREVEWTLPRLDPSIPALEVIDYKSHKPAYGMRKDGSYADGKGPAYFEDMIQQRAYGQALFEMGLGEPVLYRTVLVPDSGQYYEDTRTRRFELFLSAKEIHDDLCTKPECRAMARIYNGHGRGR
jgi:hypothetical protein